MPFASQDRMITGAGAQEALRFVQLALADDPLLSVTGTSDAVLEFHAFQRKQAGHFEQTRRRLALVAAGAENQILPDFEFVRVHAGPFIWKTDTVSAPQRVLHPAPEAPSLKPDAGSSRPAIFLFKRPFENGP